MMPTEYGSMAATVINLFDCATMMVTCTSLTVFTDDIDDVFAFYFYLNIVAMLVYFIYVPESPTWLFL